MNRLFQTFVFTLALLVPACGDGSDSKEPDSGNKKPAIVMDYAEASALNARGVLLMDQDRIPEALEAFDQLVRGTDRLFVPRFNLGIAYLNAQNMDREAREKEMERAEELFREVMAEYPGRVEAPYSLGILMEHLGRDPVEIQKLYERAVELAPNDPDCLYRLGKFYFQKRPPELAKAEANLTRALELEGHFAGAWNALFGTLIRTNEKDRAKKAMESFQHYSDSLPEQGKKLSLVYNYMGKFGRCIRQLDLKAPSAASKSALLSFANPTTAAFQTDGKNYVHRHISSGDVSGDGHEDLLVLLGNQPLATKASIIDLKDPEKPKVVWKSPRHVDDAILVDIDHDGDLDVITGSGTETLWYANEGGQIAATGSQLAKNDFKPLLQVADLDHDGDLDLAESSRALSNLRPTIYDTPDSQVRGFKEVSWPQNEGGSRGGDPFPADFDRDGDLDVLFSSATAPPVLLLNNRLWSFQAADTTDLAEARGEVSIADLDQDGRPDLVFSGSEQNPGGKAVPPTAWLNRLPGGFEAIKFEAGTEGRLPAPASFSTPADLDNDGDPDLILLSKDGQITVARNDGDRLTMSASHPGRWAGVLPRHLNEDSRLDLLLLSFEGNAIGQSLNTSTGTGNAIKLRLRGKRSSGNSAMWSNHYGIGAFIEVSAAGRLFYTDCGARLGAAPGHGELVHVGIGTAEKADSIRIIWSDFVIQNEKGVIAGETAAITEVNRKASSCPVLFKYSGVGEEFEFVTDFLGVGGLGFFQEPGVYAPADNTETVRIGDLPLKDGRLEIRVTEPMEEISYFDQLRLLVVDHPPKTEAECDERLATAEPMPSGRPLIFDKSWLPTRALTGKGTECLTALSTKDRLYQPDLVPDHRFVGYLAEEQQLIAEFPFKEIMATRPSPAARLHLFLDGWVEYPYSHVNYAAWEAGIRGRSLSIDTSRDGRRWTEFVKEAGYPGGMTRCMALDVTGLAASELKAIRLRSNLEIHVDRLRLAWTDQASPRLTRVPFERAELRFSGYPAEVSTDGRMPLLYDYQQRQQTFDWKTMAGRYTAYGDVSELLLEADQRLVVMNHGEEVALSADASQLPDLPKGWKRTFFLEALGWCKDMDPYTAFPDTVAPMPEAKDGAYPGRSTQERRDIGRERRIRGTFR